MPWLVNLLLKKKTQEEEEVPETQVGWHVRKMSIQFVGWDAGAAAARFCGSVGGQALNVPWLYGTVLYGWVEHSKSVALQKQATYRYSDTRYSDTHYSDTRYSDNVTVQDIKTLPPS